MFQSNELGRTDRERLLRTGYLQQVMKGWVISASPGSLAGDSTPWFTSFWEFCSRYCQERYGDDWLLSPEQSLLLHAGNTRIPGQVIVSSPKGTNNTINLPFDTSFYDLKQRKMPSTGDVVEIDGLRVYAVPASLIKVPESFYQHHPVEAQMALSRISHASDALRHLLAGGHSVVAGRLAAALRQTGQGDIAKEIVSVMKAAGYTVRENDPFASGHPFAEISPSTAPIVSRLQALWNTHRQTVVDAFPSPLGVPKDRERYLKAIEQIYNSDAYHSLSIEGYRVSPELIDRVRSKAWHPDGHGNDSKSHDALAARGYWQAFQRVKKDVTDVIAGTAPGELVSRTHHDWHSELFKPCVVAGLIGPDALAGYRNNAVYLRNSRHVPPRWEAVRDAMPALFDLLTQETEPSVRAVLGHWLFGYIHPYPDGNGRMARFLMNVMLASGGYPWAVIRVEDRDDYLSALEAASVKSNIKPFAQFIAKQMDLSM